MVVAQQNRVTPSPLDFGLWTLDLDLDLDCDKKNLILLVIGKMTSATEAQIRIFLVVQLHVE